MKALCAAQALRLEDIPNVGRSLANDLRLIGILHPSDLKNQDGIALYERLNAQTQSRHDPCVADVFMSAVDFMQGGDVKPWWYFTPVRKQRMLTRSET